MTTETNAERLERIRQHKSSVDYLLGGTAIKGDWNWLVKQAERAQESEVMLSKVENFLDEAYKRNRKLEKENTRLQKVLEFYAADETYRFAIDRVRTSQRYRPIEKDNGNKARQALKGELK